MHALPDAGDGSAWPLGGVACCGDEIEDPGLGGHVRRALVAAAGT
jgi:hypothetical protein